MREYKGEINKFLTPSKFHFTISHKFLYYLNLSIPKDMPLVVLRAVVLPSKDVSKA